MRVIQCLEFRRTCQSTKLTSSTCYFLKTTHRMNRCRMQYRKKRRLLSQIKCFAGYYHNRLVRGNRSIWKTIIFQVLWGRMTCSVIMPICYKQTEITCHLLLENAKSVKSQPVLLKTLKTHISLLLMLIMHHHPAEIIVRQIYLSYQRWAIFNAASNKIVLTLTLDSEHLQTAWRRNIEEL